MKKYIISVLLCVCMIIMAVPVKAYADMGPKPSVQVEFTGAGNQKYYATLLSEHESTGPATVWDGTAENARYKEGDAEYEIWKAFVEYKDADGYYFLQEFWDCTESDRMNWSYYPPSPFKILVYYPDSNSFFVTESYERYAFDSYYTVDLSQATSIASTGENFDDVKKSYDYTWEIISLIARIVLTVLLEVGIAWLFGYREKKVMIFMVVINLVTQIVLNIMLNVTNYNHGQMVFITNYIFYEYVVIVMEMIAYVSRINRISKKQHTMKKAFIYTFVSNILSFGAGLGIAYLIPGIF